MKRFLAFVVPLLAAAAIVLGNTGARADMCIGGAGVPVLPDAGHGDGAPSDAPSDGQKSAQNRMPRQHDLGAGLLFAAVVATSWLSFRRKGPGDA